MNDEPTCPFALVPGQILLANFEDLYVVRYDTHYEGHIWIRVYNKGGTFATASLILVGSGRTSSPNP